MTSAHARRQRLHDLVIALIAQQDDLPLLDPDSPTSRGRPLAVGWIRTAGVCIAIKPWSARRSPWMPCCCLLYTSPSPRDS